MIVAIMDQCSGEKQQQRGQQQQQHHQQCIAVPGQEDHPDLMAFGNHGPSKTSNRRAEDESHPCPNNLSIRIKKKKFLGNLVDQAANEAADHIPDEESACDPGSNVEVDLDRVVRDRAVHHLGNGDA